MMRVMSSVILKTSRYSRNLTRGGGTNYLYIHCNLPGNIEDVSGPEEKQMVKFWENKK